MELTYRQLEATLRGHFRISPDRASTFTSRIKQLQRLNFPSGVNIGRGVKMTYTGEHLFKLITAFELIGLGLPAQAVAGLVEKHWEPISAAYALAILEERAFGEQDKARIYMRLELKSMHDIQFGQLGNASASYVSVVDHPSLIANLGHAYVGREGYCLPIILVTDLVQRVVKIAADTAGLALIVYDEEPNRWLPEDAPYFISFRGRYPDRSNLEMRQRIHSLYDNDPESLTPEGAEEANEFRKHDFGCGVPF
jgi:hypothetical protein